MPAVVLPMGRLLFALVNLPPTLVSHYIRKRTPERMAAGLTTIPAEGKEGMWMGKKRNKKGNEKEKEARSGREEAGRGEGGERE